MPLPLLALLAAASAPAVTAPGAPLDPFLVAWAETRGYRAGRPSAVQLTPDGRAALFLRSGPRGRVQALHETDLATGATRELAGGEGSAPSPDEAARLERERIQARGITHFRLSPDGARVLYVLGGQLHVLERAGGKDAVLAEAAGALDPRFSPDGKAIAFVKDRDLHVLDLASGKARRLTQARTPEISNGLAEFVAQEEMGRDAGYWWSPDGRLLAYAEVDEAPVEKRTLCDPAFPARPCPTLAYPRAGTPNAVVRLFVVPAAGGKPVQVRWDAARFPYVAAVRWDDGGPLAVLVQERAQHVEQLLAADPRTGETRLLLEERDLAWLNLWAGMPRFLKDGRFWWVTERNGGPEVELRGRDGARLETAVPRETGYADAGGLDGDALVFVAAPDPTREEVWRVRPGEAPERLALGDGAPALHALVLPERGGGVVADTTTSLRRLPRTAVYDARGQKLADLPSVAEEPYAVPTTELRKVGPGDGLWTAVLRPRALGAVEKLPVVVEVYGGPGHLMVQPRPLLAEQWLADQGFLVVLVDGRGTPRRGRAFERAIRGDFSGAPLADQVAALQALAAELPALDLSRVGITGWSFGGYLSALAVLARPDVFRAAAAGAPVVDWREYDTHYTERYLGIPPADAAAYEHSGLLPLAPGLSRPLLLLHGTADDNVYLSHSLALADALFRAGRPFQLVPIAGATHMTPDPLTQARRWQLTAAFFADALGAVRPGPQGPQASLAH
ncbi:S9 family peptidase [Anaeromyxobacter oryzae]|uniref:Peptidase n=1 Tax=Anaeromyxobacter oryzae TaxID=2918170 RepID=A0ABN6N2L6_9BACT|nr:DPP IV N-terminal domain-containing protein [Anaeromyxobacter oryzae]BDG06255.1 peptidase [Anaeromyxobacter oryzae]